MFFLDFQLIFISYYYKFKFESHLCQLHCLIYTKNDRRDNQKLHLQMKKVLSCNLKMSCSLLRQRNPKQKDKTTKTTKNEEPIFLCSSQALITAWTLFLIANTERSALVNWSASNSVGLLTHLAANPLLLSSIKSK